MAMWAAKALIAVTHGVLAEIEFTACVICNGLFPIKCFDLKPSSKCNSLSDSSLNYCLASY